MEIDIHEIIILRFVGLNSVTFEMGSILNEYFYLERSRRKPLEYIQPVEFKTRPSFTAAID